MTTSLGGITLSDNLILGGIESAPGIAFSAKRTLGGRQIVQVGPSLSGGRVLTLQGENHFTLGQVTAIKALSTSGASGAMVHARGSFTVIVTGVDVEPTIPYADPVSTDWYSGTITLLEV
jgi:hypothetical protein